MSRYKIGDKVIYRGAFGTGPLTVATITDFGEKNDRPLADLDDGHWCYLSQIEQRVHQWHRRDVGENRPETEASDVEITP